MQTARLISIQRFCTHDGPGIRTTVFLKGCPLACAWCQNPEARAPGPELLFNRVLCGFCGRCVDACPNQAHHVAARRHNLDRTKCRRCFRCVEACAGGALAIAGQALTVAAVLRELVKDREFYDTSGGGITLSGGEPLASLDFAVALLQACRQAGLHTCVETSGYGPPAGLRRLSRQVDLWLWDIKHTNAEAHIRSTGVPLQPILENLRAVDALGGSIILRCPLIPGINLTREHLDGLADLAGSLRHCLGAQLLPYHPFGNVKAEHLGLAGVKYRTPSRAALRDAREYMTGRLAGQIKEAQRDPPAIRQSTDKQCGQAKTQRSKRRFHLDPGTGV